jgi:L-lactate dehydrogenase complex protein LldF
MSGPIAPFLERYQRAVVDGQLRTNLLNFQRSWRTTRETVFKRLADEAPALGAAYPDFDAARRHLVEAKNSSLQQHQAVLQTFVERATAAGAQVHNAATAAQAREVILTLLRDRGVRLLAKGKSMVAEEIFLNHHLEDAGLRVVETDLGEWIIQLAHETPSHMVMPAIHKSRGQVADLFEGEVHRAVDHQDINGMVNLARAELRRVFVSADAGMIGANALIAETGSVMLVTNEGNGDLVSTLPRVLIVIAGWEKLVPTLADVGAQLRLLARSATSQEITTYTSFISGAEPDRELHIVIVDNGRSQMYADPAFRDALRCIRCAACADICPPYQVLGGHVFGYVYSGAIGLVNTPFHHGLDAAAGPQALCVSCNACATVCPAEIPLPRQILDVRARVVAARGLSLPKRLLFGVFCHPRLFDTAARVASVAQRPLVRNGRFVALPLPRRWAWRLLPALAPRPARDRLFGRVFEPALQGPWAQSGARGKTIAYFIQCVTDRFAPEQAHAAVRLLQACGARVVVPTSQHCCGLPHLDSGDLAGARVRAKQTIVGLERVQAEYIVTAAASCAAAILHDYAHLLRDEPGWRERAAGLAERTMDILSFIERVASPPSIVDSSRASPVVTYHSFCQSTNVLGIAAIGPRLLRQAGFEVAELPEATVCCGFGGATSIDYPEVGQGIVNRKLENVRSTGAAVLCTDNPGCILHLRGAAAAARDRFEVRHIVEVLADRVSAVMPPLEGPPG